MKKLLEEERQEKREQRQKEYLAKSTKIPKKTESVNKQDYANLKQRGKLERILKHLPPDDYYSNSPIKPGFGFLECLINGRRSITSLQINIPESYYCSDRPYFLYTNANGFVDIRTDFRVYEFMQRVFDFKVHSNNEMDQIAAVFRVRGDL